MVHLLWFADDETDRKAFIDTPWVAVLSTLGSDHRIHAAPVWYGWDGARFRIYTSLNSSKPETRAVRAGRSSASTSRMGRGTGGQLFGLLLGLRGPEEML
jgi:hypothetical protein